MRNITKSPHEKCNNSLKVRMKNVFDMDYDIERILSPKALNVLKYFYKNAKEYAIVAAGQGQMVELAEKKTMS